MSLSATDALLARVDAAKLTPRYWATFGLIVLQLVCEIFDFAIVGFLVSAVAPEWGLNFGQITIILLSAGVGAMVGGVCFGWLSDRFGRKAAVVGGAMVYTLGAGAIALIPDGAWMMFAFLRFVVGVGYGGAGTSQFALVAEYTPTRFRTLMTGVLGVPASLGVLLAALLVAQLFPVFGWRGVAALGALPIVVGFAIAFVAPESPRWLIANGRGERARKTLSSMLGGKVDLPLAADAPRPKVPVREVFRDPRRLALILMIQFGMGTALTGVLLWGPTILAQAMQVSPAKAGEYFVWVSLAGLAGRVIFTFLPLKIGRVKSGLILAYGGALFLALAGYFHDGYLAAIPLFLVFLMMGQMFYDGGYSNINPYAVEVFPVRIAALGAGLGAAAGGVGKIAGPLILGLIAGTGNLVTPKATEAAIEPAFFFLSLCCVIAGLAYSFLGIETHNRPVPIN